jgi:serine protease AprX
VVAALLGLAPPASADVAVVVTGESVAAVEAVVRANGGEVSERLEVVRGVAAALPGGRLGDVEAHPVVDTVSPDAPVRVQGQIDSSGTVRSPYRDVTGATGLAAEGTSGAGVTVALIDTGVAELPDVAGRVLRVTDPVTGASSPCVDLSGERSCGDSYGHGTFMAGIIMGDGSASGGRFTGMAPRADLISLKVAGRDGSSDVSKVLSAIQWTVQNKDRYGIDVLNLSLGTDSTASWRVDPLNYAVERAWEAGIVVVVSAANFGPAPGTIAKPADDPWVLTVGATDDAGTTPVGDDRLPGFTSRGPTADGVAKPDLVAPGAHVISLRAPGSAVDQLSAGVVDGSHRRGSGTSMAAATVSGGAALLLERHPHWSPSQVKEALRSTARATGASKDPAAVGAGAVDLVRASSAGQAPPAAALERSTGRGSLDSSRGTVEVRADDPAATVLDASLTAQLLLWDPVGFTTGDWGAGTAVVPSSTLVPGTWYATTWHGNNWQGNNWQGNNWQGNNWQGNNWQGTWSGSTTDGGSRTEETYGLPWFGAAWYGLWG